MEPGFHIMTLRGIRRTVFPAVYQIEGTASRGKADVTWILRSGGTYDPPAKNAMI